jgi:hypothetical protein
VVEVGAVSSRKSVALVWRKRSPGKLREGERHKPKIRREAAVRRGERTVGFISGLQGEGESVGQYLIRLCLCHMSYLC